MNTIEFAKTCGQCGEPAVARVLLVEDRKCVLECDLCDDHAVSVIRRAHSTDPKRTTGDCPYCEIHTIVARKVDRDFSCGVYFKEIEGPREFTLAISYISWCILYWTIKSMWGPFPSACEVIIDVVTALGGVLQDLTLVAVLASKDEEYVGAKLRVDKNRNLSEFDIRPNDGVNIAVLSGIQIRIDDKLLSKSESQAKGDGSQKQ